jgi:hypothetical protein
MGRVGIATHQARTVAAHVRRCRQKYDSSLEKDAHSPVEHIIISSALRQRRCSRLARRYRTACRSLVARNSHRAGWIIVVWVDGHRPRKWGRPFSVDIGYYITGASDREDAAFAPPASLQRPQRSTGRRRSFYRTAPSYAGHRSSSAPFLLTSPHGGARL